MSIRTTIALSREEAEEKLNILLMKKLSNINNMSDEEIEYELIEESYNYLILESLSWFN